MGLRKATDSLINHWRYFKVPSLRRLGGKSSTPINTVGPQVPLLHREKLEFATGVCSIWTFSGEQMCAFDHLNHTKAAGYNAIVTT